jgi:hypothetical protein
VLRRTLYSATLSQPKTNAGESMQRYDGMFR